MIDGRNPHMPLDILVDSVEADTMTCGDDLVGGENATD